ncbi:MAG: VWA domain-containing protein [Bacteroidetes bacterium]|nr:VWA domain-containing protein [Bacteroidota bacterium]
MKHGFIRVLPFLMLIPALLSAQPSARVTTIDMVRGSTEAELTVSVICDDIVQYILTEEQLIITDNGIPVVEYTITESSSPSLRAAISAALVIDASGSMAGQPNAEAKTAAQAFISFMDGQVDEAAVLWFNQTVNVQQQMTSIKAMLTAAVDAVPASGATAVWDAAYEGVREVAANAANQKRAVVLLSDGGDNSSMHSPQDVIQYAQAMNIRVFTVGLGMSIQRTELQSIAMLTGGQYFETPNANDLQVIFTTIASFMARGFDEHTISFRSPDPDAVRHTISVRVSICGDVAEASHSEDALFVSGITQPRPVRTTAMELGQNAPNPFTAGAGTVIPYAVTGGASQHVTLEVYDLLGRRMAVLTDRMLPPGAYTATFSGDGLARGTYLYRLSSGGETLSRMLTVR